MEELHIDGLAGKAYTLEAYAKALKKRVQLVIWRMPGGKCKLFFSTKLSMKGEEVLKTYRTRFQIEFCYPNCARCRLFQNLLLQSPACQMYLLPVGGINLVHT